MVTARDEAVHRKVKVLSLHGMTADAWSRFVGGPTGYEVVEAGFKYNMTDLAASLALPQLEAVEQHWKRRENVWLMYNDRLSGLPLRLPALPESDSRHAYHLYTPLLKLEEISVSRDKIVAAIDAERHWHWHSLCAGPPASLLSPAFRVQRCGFSERHICRRAHHLASALACNVGAGRCRCCQRSDPDLSLLQNFSMICVTANVCR